MTGRLGRYELHDVVGTGGFATVYRATDPSLEAIVAVKVLADNWSRDPEVRRRFRAEAVLLRRVQAGGSIPGLATVYDIDEDDSGQPYFVMSYADRGTLARRAKARRWSAADVVPIIDALAETVGALHDNGIVHRDLKPTNVLLRSDGQASTAGPGQLVGADERVLVGDLGLAKDLRREATSMSFAGGTRLYLAPEQLDVGTTVDHRADVHAASAIISELLTGSPRPPSGPESKSGVSPALYRALEQGLAPDRDDRFPSMSRWREGLVDAMRPTIVGGTWRPANGARPPAAESGEAATYRVGTDGAGPSVLRRWWVASGLAALAVVVALGWLAVRLVTSGGIVGPDEVVVGEAVRYRAPANRDEPVLWIGPNGEQVRDEDLEVRAVVPGRCASNWWPTVNGSHVRSWPLPRLSGPASTVRPKRGSTSRSFSGRPRLNTTSPTTGSTRAGYGWTRSDWSSGPRRPGRCR